jgi:hypothetical protein
MLLGDASLCGPFALDSMAQAAASALDWETFGPYLRQNRILEWKSLGWRAKLEKLDS